MNKYTGDTYSTKSSLTDGLEIATLENDCPLGKSGGASFLRTQVLSSFNAHLPFPTPLDHRRGGLYKSMKGTSQRWKYHSELNPMADFTKSSEWAWEILASFHSHRQRKGVTCFPLGKCKVDNLIVNCKLPYGLISMSLFSFYGVTEKDDNSESRVSVLGTSSTVLSTSSSLSDPHSDREKKENKLMMKQTWEGMWVTSWKAILAPYPITVPSELCKHSIGCWGF